MSTTQNLSFQPLMGEEAKIKQLTQTEGYLGFSTDTKKCFLV